MQDLRATATDAATKKETPALARCRACKGRGARQSIGSRMMARPKKAKSCTGCGGAGFVSAKHRLAMAAESGGAA